MSRYQSKDTLSLPTADDFSRKFNKNGFKFGDAMMDYEGRKCYVIGHTPCLCTVVYEPIYRPPRYVCVATLQNKNMTLVESNK